MNQQLQGQVITLQSVCPLKLGHRKNFLNKSVGKNLKTLCVTIDTSLDQPQSKRELTRSLV
jgi:hypothetical protein